MIPADQCVVCRRPLGEHPIRMRYEQLVYAFDRDACKRIFQENPDRYLDAGGGVLPEPRG
jgi:YHS domain-containing protein